VGDPPSQHAPRSGRRIAACIWTVVVGLVCLEGLSYAVGRYLQTKWCMYGVPRTPPSRIVASYADYLARRDPDVGWPFPDQFGSALFTATGARPSPAFPDTTPDTSVVSLYGSSFTQSSNSDAEAWGNVLAQIAGVRVANYGQGGYGTDQAYLRYKRTRADRSPIVILTQVSEDILRDLTRDRDLVLYETWWSFKPRFVLAADGSLQLVPLPQLSEEESQRLVGQRSPPLVLEHESFCPGGPAGVTVQCFPYTWSLFRGLGDFRLRAKLAHRPTYAEFYAPGHPLHGLEIAREICRAFAAEARARGQHPLVMLLPNREDVEHDRRTGEWYYAPLKKELEGADFDVLDFGDTLLEVARDRDLDSVYDASGHFTPAADHWLAEFVLAQLKRLPDWESSCRSRSG